ncbi:PoNe immunity protein domain-containing protein [Cupriavidus gilardii]|uniref:PoNe immunity protein domain-containing protein n=1 Tax=Cupriavidus gilardii TaxID=82541 RepID=UPI0007E3C792|nr:PoNe immunity protein domain-containing protein [Cupriavidus gilardii]
MDFHLKRRQQFLTEENYVASGAAMRDGIQLFESHPAGVGDTEEERWLMARSFVADDRFNLLCLRYTAGEPIIELRGELESVICAIEQFAALERDYYQEPDRSPFVFTSIDDYSRLLQLIGLCYLLHRRDLLPRIADLSDYFRGQDAVYEDLLGFSITGRPDVDEWFWDKPYGDLIKAFYKDNEAQRLDLLHRFLKRWYKDLAGTGWHDAHKPDSQGRTGGYYGYWSFEAGAAVLLLGIEDDSSLHSFLYYPKDMVAWAKANVRLQENTNTSTAAAMRCEPSQPCPRAGYWLSPAKANSRRYFSAGEIMPDVSSDYGTAIWQWDVDQSDPRL